MGGKWYCLSRTVCSGAEYSGRAGGRVYTQMFLLPEGGARRTIRERECLKWAAEGKTAWETGQILGIAERTAVFHVNNVIQKLGATNKTQAIVRALALNMI